MHTSTPIDPIPALKGAGMKLRGPPLEEGGQKGFPLKRGGIGVDPGDELVN